MKIKAEKIAHKLADLLADSRFTLSDWKYLIPFYLIKQEDSILIKAKNFADGIDYQMERYGIDIPAEFVVAYPEDNMIEIDGKEYRGHNN
jgi:hypothetical protein